MKLGFDEPQRQYDSGSQVARVTTELWIEQTIFCPNCGNRKLNKFPANMAVADFFCGNCNDQYELKSQKKDFGKKVVNGAYDIKIKRLESDTSPNLLLLRYDKIASEVRSLCVIPKRFFVPSIVEKRKPLSPNARRAGWVGSNILIGNIPKSGRIYLIQDGVVSPKEVVLAQWQKTAFLNSKNLTAKGWLLEIMSCIDQLKRSSFTLDDVYRFEQHLGNIYPGNNNVRAKIRQQLQILRDNGYVEFKGNGSYRLIS